MGYFDLLIDRCRLAKQTKPLNRFIINDTDQLDGIKNAIYIISAKGICPDVAYEKYREFKSLSSFSCSKINKRPSETLYVGSSTTNPKSRILNHLGHGSRKTYSLHMDQCINPSNYIIEVYEFDDDIEREVLQLIEDDMASKMQPAFGKRGPNSN